MSRNSASPSTPITHELVKEVDQLPVFFNSPGRDLARRSNGCVYDELTVPIHWHEYVEFIWLVEGHMTAIVQADTYELSPGDLLTINGGELHMTKLSRRQSYCPYVLLQVSPQRLKEAFPDLALVQFSTCLRSSEIEKDPALLQSLSAMQQLFEEHAQGYQLLFTARLFEFLHAMYCSHCTPSLQKAENSTARDLNRIRQTIAWTQENFREMLTLEDAAAQIGISKEYFCRIFKKYTGQTYLDYLCMIRTTHFYTELQESELSIPMLMERNGLTNYKTFMRTFHALYGTTPQKVRSSTRA